MTELARLELAVCALAATVLAVMVVVGVDALRFHGASLVLVFEALVLAEMAGSFAREAWRQHRFRARLPAECRVVCGAPSSEPTRNATTFPNARRPCPSKKESTAGSSPPGALASVAS